MRDVNYGWLIRYGHSNGASFFFICVYIHIARGLYYGSYSKPRTGLWTVGVIIYFLMMGTAFLGYLHSLTCYNFLSHLFFPAEPYPVVLSYLLFRNLNSRRQVSFLSNLQKVYKNLDGIPSQLHIKNENRNKAAIYCIFNCITGESFIGSACTNRINSQFRNHCINGNGNPRVRNAINIYGLENFNFIILEYYSGLVLKANLSKSHLNLLALEHKWIHFYSPEYNSPTSSSPPTFFPFKPSQSPIRFKLYSVESEDIGNHSETPINLFSLRAYKNTTLGRTSLERYLIEQNLRKKLAKNASKPVILYLKDNITIHSKYSSIRNMAKAFSCCHKTINKSLINNTIFKQIGYIKSDK